MGKKTFQAPQSAEFLPSTRAWGFSSTAYNPVYLQLAVFLFTLILRVLCIVYIHLDAQHLRSHFRLFSKSVTLQLWLFVMLEFWRQNNRDLNCLHTCPLGRIVHTMGDRNQMSEMFKQVEIYCLISKTLFLALRIFFYFYVGEVHAGQKVIPGENCSHYNNL